MDTTNDTDLDERLAAARSRRNAAATQRQTLAEAAAKLLAVEEEERNASDEEAIAAAEEKHDPRRIAVIRTSVGCVIVKRPNPLIYKRFRDKGDAKTTDLEKLVRACLVHPDGDALDKVFDQEPAALDRAANAIVELAGFRAKEVSEK